MIKEPMLRWKTIWKNWKLFLKRLGRGTGMSKYTNRPMTFEEANDISHWYAWVKREHSGVCPTCGVNLAIQRSEFNIAPHFMLTCRRAVPDPGADYD